MFADLGLQTVLGAGRRDRQRSVLYHLAMDHDLRFHVLTLPNVGWEECRDRVQLVESLGFDIVEVGDHFCDWANPPAPWFEAWTSLAAFATVTSTIRLATCVAQIPLRNPGVLAHQAVTIDHISGGRFELGLGTGITVDPSTTMIGLPNWSNAERVARFGEYVELVGMLLSQENTSYQGQYYSAQGAVMNPSSYQSPRVPVMVAALGPKMMEHAARFADIWNTMSFDAEFDAQLVEMTDRAAAMDALCTRVGRDPSSLRRSVLLFDAEARGEGGRIRYYDDHELFVKLVRQLVAVGYTDIGVYYPSVADQMPAFERLGLELLPMLRSEHDA
jgi:alkanesulfonate monooxygenase SsuD/methylene tetrahydromethanopterin reductase-like flavin-dependent oxidoreductase (luciferase family)